MNSIPAGRLNGSSLGELVNSPSLRCQRSVPGNVAVSEAILDRAARSRGVSDPTNLLLVDAGDRLQDVGPGAIPRHLRRGGIGLVLIGMPGLERRLAGYAQLYSRIGFVHEIRPLGTAEVRTLLAGWRPSGVPLPEDLLADAEGDAGVVPGHRRELPITGPAADAGRANPRTQRAQAHNPRSR